MSALEPMTVGFPIDGQAYDLASIEDAAALAHRCDELVRVLRGLKERADQRLRDELEAQAATLLAAGEFEVTETTGRATYDVQALMDGLEAAGMNEQALGALFQVEWKVRDGKDLNKLATRHDLYAKVIAAATTRSRGYIKVKARRSQAPAPRTPDAIRDQVKADRAIEDEAHARGI